MGHALYGVLDCPAKGARWDTICILGSPGIKPRVAPHRLYRKLAQVFVERGIPVLRLDFSGMGDSEGELPETSLQDVYRSVQAGRHVPDVRATMDELARVYGASSFIVGGLCGAAITGLLAAEGDSRVVGLFSVAMPTAIVGHEAGTASLSRGRISAERQLLQRKLWHPRTWLRVVTLQSDYRLWWSVLHAPIVRGISRLFNDAGTSDAGHGAASAVAPPADLDTNFVRAFFALTNAGIPAMMLFGGADEYLWEWQEKFAHPWHNELKRVGQQVQLSVVEGANHIFGNPAWVAEAQRLTRDWLDHRVLGGGGPRPRLVRTSRIELVSDFERFLALRTEWTALLARSGSNSVTLTWEWLSTWWRVFHEARSLRIVAVWEGDRLIGAAPLLRRDRLSWGSGIVPTRRLELLASGEDLGHMICSDYIDWIAETGRESQVVILVLDALRKHDFGRWQEILLPDISIQSPNLEAMRVACQSRNLHLEVQSSEPCPYIDLPASWDEYLNSLSSSHRYRVRRAMRDFVVAGGTYRVAENEADIASMFPMLVKLHQARWEAKGELGAFRSPLRRRFHELFMPLALAQGWLRLGILMIGDHVIGAIYNLRYAGRVYFYQSGIELQESNNLRPGVLLHAHEIAAAIEAGCREYDFLKRGESQYKDAWARSSRDLVLIRIARRGLHDRATKLARAARAGAATIKHRLVKG
jgi:CelD/BcsL family acetyltransferase involved in cellulose biosynthesis